MHELKKILVIEDNKDLAENITLLLKEQNFNVNWAYTGAKSLQLISEIKFDLILCDIMLPDISGFKLLAELKKITNHNFPIFIFMTAKTLREDMRKGMVLGADDYLTKPFTYEELLDSINTQLQKNVRRNVLADNKKINKKVSADSKIKRKLISDEKQYLNYDDHIFLDDKKNPGLYPIKNIIVIRSMKDYTIVNLDVEKKFIVRRSMTDWEKKLPPEKFVRIHRQTIINLDFIQNISLASSNRYLFTIKNHSEKLEVSQRYVRKIKDLAK